MGVCGMNTSTTGVSSRADAAAAIVKRQSRKRMEASRKTANVGLVPGPCLTLVAVNQEAQIARRNWNGN
jgi:hypothetical protein